MALRLEIIIGSVRDGRHGPRYADWIAAHVRRQGAFEAGVVDLADVPLPASVAPFGDRPEPLAALARRLDAADAFIVVTPEFNHSYPAALKHFVDWHYEEWRAKPVGFVSYGGVSGGLRAVEHLRLVFAELHAVAIRDGVSFDNHFERFDADGNLTRTEGADTAAKTLLDRLDWWASVLRDARRTRPYAA
ncbi:NADPH-dependent FMN reductase [Spirillospora albida]|uniref:NADPH-dependent FMN reductase n=1 Tax=Spirillospora albida TaxID=58123 RepID=UPI0004C047FA|nr:NAD(P)H-dependent oxidoreductase [Spirillospora albida]